MLPTPDLTDAQLAELVDRFYAAVRADPLIGGVFDAAIADWPDHLGKLAAFWSSVMLGTRRYHGSPMLAHLRHADRLTPAMFARWLALWGETTQSLFPPPVAAQLQDKAARIADSLQLGLRFHADKSRKAVS
ncbi:preprotein translocase subunit TatC [Elstera litoralis]|uniref:Preprotein translocase subunit TatC n=1 Tax=Elstera litoralis TaxID=552518 RepID=A0A0F3IT68_9PROT|nr:group III truncated hemoglobin [Elstera litoralis]KJV09817.1 preprotein translocase subunit TatC [Elstera litoralis]